MRARGYPTDTTASDLITELAMILAASYVRLLLRRESPCASSGTEGSCSHTVDGQRGQEVTT